MGGTKPETKLLFHSDISRTHMNDSLGDWLLEGMKALKWDNNNNNSRNDLLSEI